MLKHLGYGILERVPGKDIGNHYFGGMDIFTHFKRGWLTNLYVISELKKEEWHYYRSLLSSSLRHCFQTFHIFIIYHFN